MLVRAACNSASSLAGSRTARFSCPVWPLSPAVAVKWQTLFFSLISVINCIEVITLLNLALSPACLQQGSETAEVSVCFGTFALPLALQELACSSCAAAELGGRAVLGEQDRWIPASLVSDRSRIFISVWFFPPAVASKVGRCGS